jgi:hypothetical protein
MSPLICLACCACSIEQCDSSAKVLSNDGQGHTIWRIDEACTGLVAGGTVALALSRESGAKTTFFKYEDVSWSVDYHDQSEPSIKWIARDHLDVSIGALAEIIQILDKVGDITITYHIGHIVEPVWFKSLEAPGSTSRSRTSLVGG